MALASFKRAVASKAEIGEQLLSLAADEQTDLLVMGCYGHGRAREWARCWAAPRAP